MVRRSLWWMSVLAMLATVALVSLAAVSSTPPNLSKTLEAQRKLAAEKPNDAGVFNDLGNLLHLSHRQDEAETAYRRAVELDPDRVSALFNLGLLLQEKGEIKEAAKLYRQLLKLEPRHAWANYQLGSIQEAGGEERAAIDSYARSFALDPQLAFPQVNPQIVDNKLVTQAMLRAYHSGYSPTQAPKVYDEPGRIASLLVARPLAAAPKDAAPAAANAAPGTTLRPGAPGMAATSGTKGQASGTVLRAQDLGALGAPTGQAMPPGSTAGGARNPYGGGVRATVPQPGQPGLREWNRPDPNAEQPSEEEYSEEGIQQVPPPVIPAPPAGVYYRPGMASSSRLNLEVIPGRPAPGRLLRGSH